MLGDHGLADEVNCSMLLTELPLLERPAAARAAGFAGVELWWPFPAAVPADGEVEAFVRATARPGTLHLDMSTIRPDVAGRLAGAGRERGLRVLDAPQPGPGVRSRPRLVTGPDPLPGGGVSRLVPG
jgi:hypothetical protein